VDPFGLNCVGTLPIASGDQHVDEAPVVLDAGEVAASAQDQRLLDGRLEVPVLGFHCAVLVGLTTVVATGIHPVMADEGIVALGDVFALIGGQVAESCGQAVGPMVLRHATERPKRLLQVLGQRREAFPAKDHADMLPTTVGHGKMVEQMREWLACDRHRQLFGMGEVGLGHVSRLRCLAEDDVALGPVQRPPLPHPPLQGAADPIIGERQRLLALKMTQQGDGLQRAVLLKQGEKVVLPKTFKRVGHRASMKDLALRRRCRVGIETSGSPFAEPGAGGRCALTVVLEVGHIQSQLLVGDGFVGQPGSSV